MTTNIDSDLNADANPNEIQEGNSWQQFLDKRLDYLLQLSEPILHCTQQKDTEHPAFCGCIDWHSSVHGTYSLLVLARLTQDPSFMDVANQILDPIALKAEFKHVRDFEIAEEIPYGYAWFLTLAKERAASGKQDLNELACEIEFQLANQIVNLSEEEFDEGIMARQYLNLSWAISNLYDWAKWQNDSTLMSQVVELVQERLLPLDEQLPLKRDQEVIEFFAPSLMRMRTILKVLPVDESKKWLTEYLKQEFNIQPIISPPKVHTAGLNFSRSWCFWSLYQATKDTTYRDLYQAHIETHMSQPAYWKEDYRKYSHWVAQFGVYGIALSFDEV